MSQAPIRHLALVAAILLASSISAGAVEPQTPATQTTATQTTAPSTASTPALHGDPAHPPETQGWVETRLYFGLGPSQAPGRGVTPAAWQAFLDQVVTPRFPAGLSVSDLYGQWQGRPAPGHTAPRPSRIRSKVLIIVYPATSENDARIDAIRSAWKQRTGDQSVLKVTHPVDVSF